MEFHGIVKMLPASSSCFLLLHFSPRLSFSFGCVSVSCLLLAVFVAVFLHSMPQRLSTCSASAPSERSCSPHCYRINTVHVPALSILLLLLEVSTLLPLAGSDGKPPPLSPRRRSQKKSWPSTGTPDTLQRFGVIRVTDGFTSIDCYIVLSSHYLILCKLTHLIYVTSITPLPNHAFTTPHRTELRPRKNWLAF